MRLSELCIRRPVMTTLVMASLLLAGFFGYRQLPIAAIPRIEVPTITVTAQYPGASPDTMAVSVAAPLERQFSTIAGITAITSLNTEGTTQITLEFDLNRNIDAAALDVQSAISVAAARLPEDLPTPPAYRKVNPADTPVIFLALTSETAPSQEMNEFADKVMSPRLSMLPGVAQVNIQGAQKRAVRIRYDLDALATRGISVEEIRQAVAAQSSVSSDRQHPHAAAALHPGDQGRRADGGLLQAAWSSPGATARRCACRTSPRSTTSVENEEARAEFNGKRSIIVSVQRQPDANTVAVTDAIQQAAAAVPAGAAADHQAQRLERPLRVDPRRRARRADHADADGGAGDPGDPGLPAHLARHLHPGRRPAAVDHRHVRRHGDARLLARQRQPAGADAGARASWSTTPSSCSRTSCATSSRA